MKVTHWKKALESAVLDNTVGIRIAPLTDNNSFGMYVTEILPGKKIGAHYHQDGGEIYEIIRGKDTLHTATVQAIPPQKMNQISTTVAAGDFFSIEPGVAHQLVNTGDESLILIFGCPATHLSSDRVMVSDF
jgi:quercetin dioxygenase-like cupin family protein